MSKVGVHYFEHFFPGLPKAKASRGLLKTKKNNSLCDLGVKFTFSVLKIQHFILERNMKFLNCTGAGSDLVAIVGQHIFTPFLKNLSSSTFPLAPINRVRRRPGTFQGAQWAV